MVEHVWSVLCNHAIIDSVSNSLSLLLTVDQIMLVGKDEETLAAELAAGRHGVNVKLTLVAFWARSDFAIPERAVGSFRIIAPSGGEANVDAPLPELPIDLTEKTGFRNRIHFEGFPISEGVGLYWIEVRLRERDDSPWKTVARLPVNISLQKPDEAKTESRPDATRAPTPKPTPARRGGKRR